MSNLMGLFMKRNPEDEWSTLKTETFELSSDKDQQEVRKGRAKAILAKERDGWIQHGPKEFKTAEYMIGECSIYDRSPANVQ